MDFVGITVGGLAVWRLSRAMVKEHGPLDIFIRLRAYLATKQKRSGGLFDMVSCVACTSFWIGLVASLWTAQSVFDLLWHGLAFSGFAVLLESLIAKNPDTFKLVAPPTANDEIFVRTRSTSE